MTINPLHRTLLLLLVLACMSVPHTAAKVQLPHLCQPGRVGISFKNSSPICRVAGARALEIEVSDGCFVFNFLVEFCTPPQLKNMANSIICMFRVLPLCQGDGFSGCVPGTVEKCVAKVGRIVQASAIG